MDNKSESVKKQNKFPLIPLIECVILSFPLLIILYATPFILLSITDYSNFFDITNSILITVLFFPLSIVFIIIVSLIFYFILNKKFKLEAAVFFYSVGFASGPMILILGLLFLVVISARLGFGNPTDIPTYMWTFYIIPLMSLFYSYAVWLKNNEKGSNGVALFLLGITVVFLFIIRAIKIELFFPFFYLGLSIPSLLGFYAGYVVIYKTRPSLRYLAWTLVLVLISIFFSLIFGYRMSSISSLITLLIGPFIVPFILVCLIGIIVFVGYVVIYKTRSSLRYLATPTLILISIGLLILFFVFSHILGPGMDIFFARTHITSLIYPFVVSFVLICLIGIVHKRFTKMKWYDEMLNALDSNRGVAADLIKEDHDENTNTFDSNHDDKADLIKEDHDENTNGFDSNHDDEADLVKEGLDENTNGFDSNHGVAADLIKEEHNEKANGFDR